MPQRTIHTARRFATLEAALAQELAALANTRNVWVLVPGNLAALHLRRAVALRTGGLMGPRFLTLKDAAAAVALPHLAARGLRPMPAGAAELALEDLLSSVPAGSYLAAFRDLANGPATLAVTFELLADCLWTPTALQSAGDGPGRLREMAALWARLVEWKAERGLFDDSQLVSAAGLDDAPPADAPDALILYGFYDLNPAQCRLVARLAHAAQHASAYVLWDDSPDFAYAAPFLDWLTRTLGARVNPLADDGPEPALSVLSCPGDAAEADEVVREVLRNASSGPAAGGFATGVLLRSPADKAALIAEAADRAGVRIYMREGMPLNDTPSGRFALALMDVAADEADRAALMDVLSASRAVATAGFSPTALDRLTRGVALRSTSDWAPFLRERAVELNDSARNAEDEESSDLLDSFICVAASGFIERFLKVLNAACSATTWTEAASRLADLIATHAPADDAVGKVTDAARELAHLDVTGMPPSPDRLRRAFSNALAARSLARPGFQHAGAAVSGLMAARAVTFDTVIVPGLVEKGFPLHGASHSLLTEPDREMLNARAEALGCGAPGVGHDTNPFAARALPLQARRPLEERYLFRVAAGSARRALVLCFSRLDEDKSRPRVPSRFVLEACSATAADLDSTEHAPAMLHRVPLRRTWASSEDLLTALDVQEFDAAVFTGPTGAERRTDYLASLCENFARAAQMERSRWREPGFGPWSGAIRAADLHDALADHCGMLGRPMSPSRLETYAECPFHYFLAYVLGAAEAEEPEELSLSPRERGALVHDLLHDVYTAHLAGCRIADITDADVDRIVRDAAARLDSMADRTSTDRPALWAAEREHALGLLRRLLAFERREHANSRPELLECDFGMGGQDPLEWPVGDVRLAFRGRIDRVDLLPDGALLVVDYKTGRPDRLRKLTLRGGTQLQLPLYIRAAARIHNADHGRALYLMVDGPADVPEWEMPEPPDRADALAHALRLIVEGIAAGEFFPLPADHAGNHCKHNCPFRIVCGAAREAFAVVKPLSAGAQTARLDELRAIQ